MKYFLNLFLFILIPFHSIAQDKSFLKDQALIVANATIKNDYTTIIKYTHPSLINMAGGSDALMKVLTATMKTVADQGIQIDSVIFGTAGNIFKAGDEIHCLLPQETIMKFGSDKHIISKGYLLAVSNDNGLNWTFLNLTSGLTNETITKLLPNFNQELKLPTDSKTEIVNNSDSEE